MPVRSVVFDIIGRDRASSAFLRAAGAADTAAGRFERANARIGALGRTMTKAITLPVVAAGAASIKAAVDFEQATNVYVTAAGESSKNLAVIRDGIKKTAVETGTSIKNLTDAQYLVEKAGLRGASGLRVLNAAAKGAREENAQLTDVVQAMTSVMASYHISTSRSVQVMNALKTGAGQAKVSMEDYAKSLSTVIPIASANKVSLQQVLGAMSTLTQHGTSADEATQELGATIRSLSAPNRVAQNQMQQLGLSVNDVTTKIGKRGLTGTIDLLVGAITSHMGKAGTVIQTAMNNSASAMQDVQVMLTKMPPQVKHLAEQYQAGTISLDGWRQGLKKLPTDQASLGKQFQTLTDKAKGFNALLRSGDPAAQTFTSALKKMAGGAIGLNTILQLSGENTAGFKRRTVEVGKSLHNTSKEVEGWAATQKLAATRLGSLKASIHVLAIDLGNQLLPAFTKLVDKLSGAVQWFSRLSDGTKQTILKIAMVAAVAGPVIAILSRLASAIRVVGTAMIVTGLGATRFVQGLLLANVGLQTYSSGAFQAGMRIRAGAGLISGAMGKASAAIGGAGLGFVIGQMTQNASEGARALGTLASVAAGAAQGFAIGGPLGAGIGALTGLLGNLAGQWGGQGKAAHDSAVQAAKWLASENDAAQNLLGTLQSVNGAYGMQTRMATVHQLSKGGSSSALALADKAGIDPGKLTDATLKGNATSFVNSLYNTGKLKLTDAEYEKLVATLGQVQLGSAQAERQWELMNRAQHGSAVSARLLRGGIKNLATELRGSGTDLQYQAKRWNEVDGKWGHHNYTVNASSAFAKRNTQVVRENLAQINKQAAAMTRSGVVTSKVSAYWTSSTRALRAQLIQLGFSTKAVDTLFKQYAKAPKNITTNLKANGSFAKKETADVQARINKIKQGKVPGLSADSTAGKTVIAQMQALIDAIHQGRVPAVTVHDAASTELAKIQYALDALHNKEIDVTTYVQQVIRPTAGRSSPNEGNRSGSGLGRAAGGVLPKGFASVGERGAELAYTHDGKTVILSHRQSQKFLARTGMKMPGFAGGTNKSDPSAVASAIGGVGTAPGSKFYVKDVGIGQIGKQLAHAWDVLRAQIAKGLPKHTAQVFHAELMRYVALAQKQLSQLRVKIKTSDLTSVRHALGGSADDLRSAFTQMIADARNAGFTPKQLKGIQFRETQMLKQQASYGAAKTKLAGMKEFRSGVAGTLRGTFDPTQYGSAQDLVTGLQGQTSQNNKYAGEVARLKKLGLNKAFLTQLEQSGQTATIEALAGSSKSDIASVNKNLGAYNASVGKGADAATLQKYGLSVGSQQHHIDHLADQFNDVASALGHLLSRDTKAVIKLANGHEITAMVLQDPQFARVFQHLLNQKRHAGSKKKGHH